MEYARKIHKYRLAEIIGLHLLILVSVIAFLVIKIPFLSTALLIGFVIAAYPLRSVLCKLVVLLYSLLLLTLIQGSIITFDFIPQAEALLQGNPDITVWFSARHPHAIRLLVAYPGYLLSEFYGLDLDAGFSHYITVLFALMYLMIADTINKFENKEQLLLELKGLLIAAPLLILAFIMNGRLILAYLGFSILIRLFCDLFINKNTGKLKFFIIGSVGYLLTTVSSGTMTVALVYSLFMIYILNRKRIKRKSFIKKLAVTAIVLSPLIYSVFSYFWTMLMKNVNYYGGGFSGAINMLNHGMGRYLIFNSAVMIAAAFMGIIVLYINYRYLQRKIARSYALLPVLAAINISLYGLLFGISTGLMIIPPLIILVLIKL